MKVLELDRKLQVDKSERAEIILSFADMYQHIGCKCIKWYNVAFLCHCYCFVLLEEDFCNTKISGHVGLGTVQIRIMFQLIDF